MVFQEIIYETKTITFYTISNDRKTQIGIPVVYKSEIIRFYEEGQYYPILEIFRQSNGVQVYAEYAFEKQLQFLNLIKNPNSTNIIAYPNPTEKSYVKFEFNNIEKGKYTISIYETLGNKIKEYKFDLSSNDAVTIDLIQFKQGLYIYQIKDSNGRTLGTKKLVVLKP